MDQTLDVCFHDLPLEMVLHIAVASKNARLLLDLMLSYRRLAEFVRAHKTGIMKLFTKTIHASVKVKIYSANTVSAWNLVNGDLYVKHEIGMYTKSYYRQVERSF